MKTTLFCSISFCNIIFFFLELSHEHFVGQSSNTHGASSVRDINFSEEKNLKSFEGKNNNNDNYASINHLYRKKPYMNRSLINLKNDLFRLEPISYIQRYYKRNMNRSDIFHDKKERGSKVYSNVSSFHSFIQEGKEEVEGFSIWGRNSVLDHIDVLRDNGTVVFSVQPHYLDIYTCKEAILFTTSFYKDLDKSPITKINEAIEKINEEIIKNEEQCLVGGKTDFDNLLIVLENAEKANVRKTLFDNTFNNYKNKKTNFYNCLKNKKNDYDKKINNIKNEIRKLLKNIECTRNMCETKSYVMNNNLYLLRVNEVKSTPIDLYLNRAKELLESSTKLVNPIRMKLGDNKNMYSVGYIHEEIKDIIKRYNFHLNHIEKGKEYIKRITQANNIPDKMKKDELIEKILESSKNFASFKYSNEMISKLDSLFIKNEEILNNLFNNIFNIFKKKYETYVDMKTIESKYTTVMNLSEHLLEYAMDVLKANPQKPIDPKANIDSEIVKLQMKINEKSNELDNAISEVNTLIIIMKSFYDVIMSEKASMDEMEKKELSLNNYIEKTYYILETSDIFKSKSNIINNNSRNISSKYKIIEGLKKYIDELNSLISDFKESQETLIKDDELKQNIKTNYLNNVKYIEENVTLINEIISLKQSITQGIADIDELNSLNLININDYINEKNISQEKVSNNLYKLYKGSFEELESELSYFLDTKYLFHEKKNVNELETILDSSNIECAKLDFMKSDNNINIINLLKTELNHLLSIKENIVKKLLNYIEQNIQNSSNKYTITYTDINNRMEDYKEEIESLEVYKHTIGNIQNEYILHLYENDKNALAVHNTSMQILQYKDTIQNIKNKISDDIKILKKYKIMNQDVLNYYENLDKKLKDNTYPNEMHTTSLVQKTEYITYEDKTISELEQEFNNNNEKLDNILQDINAMNLNINILQTLNIGINRCNTNNKNVEHLLNKKIELKNILNDQMRIIKNDDIIQDNEKENFLNVLKKEEEKLEKELDDIKLNNLKMNIHKLLNSYYDSKKNIESNDKINLDSFEKEKDSWVHFKSDIDSLYVEYNICNQKTHNTIKQQKNDIIELIYKRIKDINQEIIKKVDNYYSLSDKALTKLKSIHFNIDKEKYKNPKSQENIKLLENRVMILEKKINEDKDALIQIKNLSHDHFVKADNEIKKEKEEVDDEQTHYSEKRKVMGDIYKDIKKKLDELNNKKLIDITLNEANKIESEYERILIDDICEQITNKANKSDTIKEQIESYKKHIDYVDADVSKTSNDHHLNGDNIHDSFFYEDTLNYKAYFDKLKDIYENINKLTNESNGLKSDAHNNNTQVAKLKEINLQVFSNLGNIIKDVEKLENTLHELKDMYNVLETIDINQILKNIHNSMKESEEYSNKTKKIFEQSVNITNEFIKDVEILKTSINPNYESLNDDQIDDNIKSLLLKKEEISEKRKQVNKYITDIEYNKEQSALHLRYASRGIHAIDLFIKHEIINPSNGKNFDIIKVKEMINKTEQVSNEAIEYANKMDEKNKDIIKIENELYNLINNNIRSLNGAKYEKVRKQARNAINDINNIHSNIQTILTKSKEQLDEIKKQPNIKRQDDVLNNDKTRIAYITIQINNGRIEYNLLNILNMKHNIDTILNKAIGYMNDVSKSDQIVINIDSLNMNDIYNKDKDLLINILKEKQNMEAEYKKMNEMYNYLNEIEKEIIKHKKNYEIGIMEHIKKETNEKKKIYMESNNKSLTTLMNSFRSMFYNQYINDYNINENFEKHQNILNEIYNGFNESYNIINTKMSEIINDNLNYNEVKAIKEVAQIEYDKLNKKVDDLKKYFNNIKEQEMHRLIDYIKEKIFKLYIKCSEQRNIIEDSYNYITVKKQYIRNTEDVIFLLDSLNTIEKKNKSVENLEICANKEDIKNLFKHVIKLANFSGIIIISDTKTEITPENPLEDNVLLNLQLEFERKHEIASTSENDSDLELDHLSSYSDASIDNLKVYNNIRELYTYVTHILKYLDNIQKLKGDCNDLVKDCKELRGLSRELYELKIQITSLSDRENDISNNINIVSNKLNEIGAMQYNFEKYKEVFDNVEEYKTLDDTKNAYIVKKAEILKNVDINKTKEDLDRYFNDINKLEESLTLSSDEMEIKTIVQKSYNSFSDINKNINNIDKEMKTLIPKLDELLNEGHNIDISLYNFIIRNIQIKIGNDIKNIREQENDTNICFKYIQNNYNFIKSDISIFNKYDDYIKVDNYMSNNIDVVNKHNSLLSEHVINATNIIENIMTCIVQINKDTEMNFLEETKDNLLKLYENFKKEKNIINNNYKIVHFNKLKEIENSLETYNSISTNFNKISEAQNIGILKNEFNNIKTKINDKVKELVHVDSTLTLESIQTFNKLYGDVMSNIQDFYKYEDINNGELKKVKLYIENITNLLGRINTFIKELNKYQDENNVIDKYIEINKENNSYIIKLKEKANNLKKNFSNLLQNIKRNETELYNINSIKDDIMNMWKSVNNIKQKFSRNLPLKEKLFQMEKMLLDINNIMNETKRISNTDAYTNITLQDIENNKNKENNNMNIKTIDKLIDDIKIHNEKIQAEILIIDDAKRKVNEITDNINKAFTEITETNNNDNNGVIKSAKNIVDEATYLNNELDKFLLKLNELLSHNNNDIKDLDDEKLILKEELERQEKLKAQEEERKERERIEKEKQEKERLEREKQEEERKERERLEREKQEEERKEKERIEKEKQEKERLEREKQEEERKERERLEREKQEQQQKEEELKRQEQEKQAQLQKEEELQEQEKQAQLQKEEELKRQEQEKQEQQQKEELKRQEQEKQEQEQRNIQELEEQKKPEIINEALVKGDKILEGSDQRNMELSKPNISMDNTDNSPSSNSEIIESDDIDNSESIHTSHMSDIESTQTADINNLQSTQTVDINNPQSTQTADINNLQSTQTADINNLQSTQTADINNLQSTQTSDINNLQSTQTADINNLQSTQTSHRSNTHGQEISDIVDDQITHPSNIGKEKITHNDEISITSERNNISDVNDHSESSNIFENGDSTINTSTRDTSSTHDEAHISPSGNAYDRVVSDNKKSMGENIKDKLKIDESITTDEQIRLDDNSNIIRIDSTDQRDVSSHDSSNRDDDEISHVSSDIHMDSVGIHDSFDTGENADHRYNVNSVDSISSSDDYDTQKDFSSIINEGGNKEGHAENESKEYEFQTEQTHEEGTMNPNIYTISDFDGIKLNEEAKHKITEKLVDIYPSTYRTLDEPMETHGSNENFHMFGNPDVTEEDYTEKHDYDKHEDFNDERYSNHNKFDDFVYNAGGVVCCVLFFASIAFFSMDRSNKDECDFDTCEEVYNNDNLTNYADKEEIIEIVFDENEEKYF
ncbi:reticulocyte binding protein 2 homologue b [Plasmodium reichenowi]|uniref:Reticulocyte binding protein 2 homologue b n=1 Tax=Plasmodium reichenowi TaxID=5854 RepID=A0A060RXZ9_PLARE|nr:reticulocyte binding protein 2 homologue b [Plasmodium reichenowi]